MRKMRCINTGEILNIATHVITKNFWEYYIFDYFLGSSNVNALVMGFEIESGLVDLNEIRPYVISSTENLTDVAPATGWEWV